MNRDIILFNLIKDESRANAALNRNEIAVAILENGAVLVTLKNGVNLFIGFNDQLTAAKVFNACIGGGMVPVVDATAFKRDL